MKHLVESILNEGINFDIQQIKTLMRQVDDDYSQSTIKLKQDEIESINPDSFRIVPYIEGLAGAYNSLLTLIEKYEKQNKSTSISYNDVLKLIDKTRKNVRRHRQSGGEGFLVTADDFLDIFIEKLKFLR